MKNMILVFTIFIAVLVTYQPTDEPEKIVVCGKKCKLVEYQAWKKRVGE